MMKKKEPARHNAISEDEVAIILGALHLKEKTTKDVMTPLDKVFMLSDEQVLDSELIEEILRKGHSRIPIYHGLREKKNLLLAWLYLLSFWEMLLLINLTVRLP